MLNVDICELYKKADKLAIKSNRVTSNWRHKRKVTDKDFAGLYEAQLELEERGYDWIINEQPAVV